MVIACLITVVYNCKRFYMYYQSSEKYFDRLLKQHDKDNSILNTQYSMDELAHRFHQDDKVFVNWKDPIESAQTLKIVAKSLRKERDKIKKDWQEKYDKIKNQKVTWQGEALALKNEREELQERVEQAEEFLIMNDPDLSYLKHRLEMKEKSLQRHEERIQEMERRQQMLDPHNHRLYYP